jgi:hypothetical protein
MATRCNIIIEYGSTEIYLYRQCDGDLAEQPHTWSTAPRGKRK